MLWRLGVACRPLLAFRQRMAVVKVHVLLAVLWAHLAVVADLQRRREAVSKRP